MLIVGDEITKETSPGSLGNGEYAETEVDHIDRSATVELPPMTSARGERHLPRRRDHILLNRAHVLTVLGTAQIGTKYNVPTPVPYGPG